MPSDVNSVTGPHFRYPYGVGYLLYAYARGGTVTPISTWSDADQSGLNPWPVVLAAVDDDTEDGIALVYLAEDATLLLTDPDDVIVDGWPADWVKPVSPSIVEALDDRVAAVEYDVDVLQAVTESCLDRLDVAEDKIDALEGIYLPTGAGLVGYTFPDSGVNSYVDDALNRMVYVKAFGAVGNGATNDWIACQKAVDYVQSRGGGTVVFDPGGIYRIAGNTVVIWGSNVHLVGYGAIVYKDNAGGTAGNYGDAISVLGKINGMEYYGPDMGGTYTTRAAYVGATTASVNCCIEGFNVTFGTHSQDTINGITGDNVEHMMVKNCVVTGAPQTGFAFVSTASYPCSHITLLNCLTVNAGMQGYRTIAYGTARDFSAHLINCAERGTTLTVSVPDPEMDGLPAGLYIRSSATNYPFIVECDNCQFAVTVLIRNGYNTVSFRNCDLPPVRVFSNSPLLSVLFQSCRFAGYQVLGSSYYPTQLKLDLWVEGCNVTVDTCVMEEPVEADPQEITIINYGGSVQLRNLIGKINLRSVPYDVDLVSVLKVENCHLIRPPSSILAVEGTLNEFQSCIFDAPLKFTTDPKSVVVRNCLFNVTSGFDSNCLTFVGDPVIYPTIITDGNTVLYDPGSLITSIRLIAAGLATVQNNKYVADGVTTYDHFRYNAAPTTGYWIRGARIDFTEYQDWQPVGWVCTVSGTPGTWRALPAIEPPA